MSWVEDNDLDADYLIEVSHRLEYAESLEISELIDLLYDNRRFIDNKFKDMILSIIKQFRDGASLSDKQLAVLYKGYAYNFEIDRNY